MFKLKLWIRPKRNIPPTKLKRVYKDLAGFVPFGWKDLPRVRASTVKERKLTEESRYV